MLSPEEYAKELGERCPRCGDYEVVSAVFDDIIAEAASTKARCLECGATWYERYKLHSYGNLTDKDGNLINAGFFSKGKEHSADPSPNSVKCGGCDGSGSVPREKDGGEDGKG
jgi:hypothetical protein